jgi:hypothetical protein
LVIVNHKPNFSNGTRTTKISRNSDGNTTLSITDEESGKLSKYAYKGRRSTSKSSYVLIFDPETQVCILEPVGSSYNFNLTTTPGETSQEKLARQYEQLREEAATADLDEDPDGEPEKSNPYDFRHYLNINSKPSPTTSPALRATSAANTPNLNSTRIPTTSANKPRSKPATKVDPLRQAPRKQKTAATATTSKASQKPTPTVRLDRRASTRPSDPPEKKAVKLPKPVAKGNAKSDYYVHSSDDDDVVEVPTSVNVNESGGLEIDWGNDRPKKKSSSARVIDLPQSEHDGPISLHSAANSPAGRMTVPRQQKKRHEYEEDVIDFGTSEVEGYDEDDEDEAPRIAANDRDIQMHDAEESEGDADVEPMDLGSPAHQNLADEDAEGDFDDDLEAQMMEAMNDDEDDQPAAPDESDESEAE